MIRFKRKDKSKWEAERYTPKKLQFEIFDLKTTAKSFTTTKPFNKLRRLMLGFEWTAGSWSWPNFMGGSALTNGIIYKYDDRIFTPDPIVDNFGFTKYSFDGKPLIDSDAASKSVVYPGRLSFFKIVPGGLDLTGNHKFEVITQDDMSAAGGTDSIIKLILEGWVYHYD